MSRSNRSSSKSMRGEGRGGRTGQQPAARWRRDSGSALQLLASPLVSRSPSPNPETEDEGRITDVELEEEEEAGVRSAGQEAEVPTIDLSEEEEEEEEDKEDTATETVSPEVSSDEEDEPRRAAKARMAFRRIRRAAAGSAWATQRHRAAEANIRSTGGGAAAAREWKKRLDKAEAEEAAIWAQPGPPEQPPPLSQPPPPPSLSQPPPPPSLSQPPPPPSPPLSQPPPPPSPLLSQPPPPPSPPRKTARRRAGGLGKGDLGVAVTGRASRTAAQIRQAVVVSGAAVPTSKAVDKPRKGGRPGWQPKPTGS
ncbi:formin-like protein 5 [Drosophila rhopaloa]|uniref:Uncharacterized protein n=1 Tax=Drosophila rhopaloa TaxID=1041015 RepID=A0ABM5JF54_DRORH|nr:formin-like protein 5 [Drosophila rhopaloa]